MEYLFSKLPDNIECPIFIAQHVHASQDGYFVQHLNSLCNATVKMAEDKEIIQSGFIYFAPPDYHLLLESDGSCSLSIDEKVNYSRPSLDVLFESAADVYDTNLTGILLTGANHDGAKGMLAIHSQGGQTIVQDPKTAEHAVMPQSALDLFKPDAVLDLEDIGKLLPNLCCQKL